MARVQVGSEVESMACPRCGNVVVWPVALLPAQKAAMATIARLSRIEGVKFARSEFGFNLFDAKGLAFHITRDGSQCSRCGSPTNGELSICTTCHSANIGW